MSTELNNYLLEADDQEREDRVVEDRSVIRNRVLLALGLLAGVGAAAGVAGKANADELLLCTHTDPDNGFSGTIIDDPMSNQDQVFPPDPFDVENDLDSGVSQEVYKDYILKPISNGYQTTWRVFKRINGQDVEKGILMDLAGINLLTPSGVLLTNGKTFHKVTDTGETLVAEEIGEHPGGATANFGGYVFSTKLEANQHVSLMALNEADILNHVGGGMVPVASLIELSPDSSNKFSYGINIDESTNTLVVSLKQGTIEIDLTPFLDENGQLSPDFSLTDVPLGKFKPFPPKPGDPNGYKAVGVLASNGYRYHTPMGGEVVIMQKPDGQFTVIDKEQLNGGTGVKIYSMSELVHGGVYIIFDNDPDSPSPVPPVVLHESGEITVDPGDMTPFIKQCFVIPDEYQDMFKPVVDPCANKTCPPSANQCEEATCVDGGCVEQDKPNDKLCNDNDVCTTDDHCLAGLCVATTYACPVYPCKELISYNPETGPCCPSENKPDGTPCDDYDPDTKESQCEGGECKEKPIVNPEPDVVELNPEPSPDVVEQVPDTVEPSPEPDTDVAEQEPGTTEPDSDVVEKTPDTAEPDSDAVEQDSQGETGDSEATSPDENAPDGSDALEVANPDTNPDVKEDLGGETSVDIVGEDGSEVIGIDTNPEKKAPGCGCDTHGESSDSTNGAFLLGLGVLATGIAARFRKKISAVLTAAR